MSVSEIAEDLSLPQNYLSKVLNQLVRREILSSSRGPQGGFALAARPGDLTLQTVIEPFNHDEQRTDCLLGRPRCDEANPCAAHARWKRVTDEVSAFFRETTVADLIQEDPVPTNA